MFDEFDEDGSGELDEKEVQKLCKKMGVKLNKKGLAAAMDEMDEDGSGEVGFEEFNKWWSVNAGKALDRFPADEDALDSGSEADGSDGSDEEEQADVGSVPPPPPGAPVHNRCRAPLPAPAVAHTCKLTDLSLAAPPTSGGLFVDSRRGSLL